MLNNDEVAANVSEEVKAEDVLKEAQALWRRYFVLTNELLKFSDQRDSEMFIELVDQRGRLVDKIKALPENNYRESAECQALIKQIIPMDNQIMYRARSWLNKSRRQTSTVRSYDLIDSAELRGTIFNRKY